MAVRGERTSVIDRATAVVQQWRLADRDRTIEVKKHTVAEFYMVRD